MLARRTLFLLGGASLLEVACGKPEVPEKCPGDVSPASETLRTNLKYVEKSSDAAKYCLDCTQYRPGPEGQCGGCSLIEGPIHPHGTCAAFAKKA